MNINMSDVPVGEIFIVSERDTRGCNHFNGVGVSTTTKERLCTRIDDQFFSKDGDPNRFYIVPSQKVFM